MLISSWVILCRADSGNKKGIKKRLMYIGSVNGIGVCFEDEREAIDLFSKNPSKNDDGNGVTLKNVLYQLVVSSSF